MATGDGWILAAAIGVAVGLVGGAFYVAANAAPPPPVVAEDRVNIIVEGASPDLVDFTDPATGCTYLVHRLGGVTPRLDGAGRPMCRGESTMREFKMGGE